MNKSGKVTWLFFLNCQLHGHWKYSANKSSQPWHLTEHLKNMINNHLNNRTAIRRNYLSQNFFYLISLWAIGHTNTWTKTFLFPIKHRYDDCLCLIRLGWRLNSTAMSLNNFKPCNNSSEIHAWYSHKGQHIEKHLQIGVFVIFCFL